MSETLPSTIPDHLSLRSGGWACGFVAIPTDAGSGWTFCCDGHPTPEQAARHAGERLFTLVMQQWGQAVADPSTFGHAWLKQHVGEAS